VRAAEATEGHLWLRLDDPPEPWQRVRVTAALAHPGGI